MHPDPLAQFRNPPKQQPTQSSGPRLRVAEWLRDRGVEFREHDSGQTVKWYITCPFNDQHKGTDCYITQFDSGATTFKCSHNSCAGYKWHDAKQAIGEPGPEHWDGKSESRFEQFEVVDDFLDLVEGLQRTNGNGAPPEEVQEAEPEADWGQDAGQFPEELLDVPGFVNSFAAWVNSWAPVHQPVLAMAGGLAAAAALYGGKVDYQGIRTNLYLLAMGPSGCGKDAARRGIKNLFAAAGCGQLVGAEGWRSGAGLISQLAAYPVRVFCVDEIGKLLEAIRGAAGGRSPWLQDIATQLTVLWSSASTTYEPAAYADAKRAVRLECPCATVYGTTVPDDLWGNLTESTLRDGFLARQMVLQVDRGQLNEQQANTQLSPPRDLVDYARQWWQYQAAEVAAGIGEPAEAQISPPAADAILAYRKVIRGKHGSESEHEATVWARSAEKVIKLAMIRACSRQTPGDVRIDLGDVQWAKRLVNWSTRTLLFAAGRQMATSGWHGDKIKACRILAERGQLRGGRRAMTMRDFKRRIPWLRGKDKDQLLRDLIEEGRVELVELKAGQVGRPSHLVSLIR